MPKYLVHGTYAEEGLKGLLKDGGSKRRKVVEQLIKGMGGKLEVMYFAFGEDDVLMIVDLPSSVDCTACALMVNASGAVKLRTTVLITPEEVDEATKKTVDYRPPGR